MEHLLEAELLCLLALIVQVLLCSESLVWNFLFLHFGDNCHANSIAQFLRLVAMRLYGVFTLALAFNGAARAATVDQWRSRSIYQVFTDRFSLENGSTITPCDPAVGKYCGGHGKW